MSVPATGKITVTLKSGRYYFDGAQWTADPANPALTASIIVDAFQAFTDDMPKAHLSVADIATRCINQYFPGTPIEINRLDGWGPDEQLPPGAVD
jgi:hypothetical protein